MADINYEELEDLTLTMEDEDGTTTECELQFVFEYDGQDYGAFCDNARVYTSYGGDEWMDDEIGIGQNPGKMVEGGYEYFVTFRLVYRIV